MKKLMTEWRKVLEGDVIKFELPPDESDIDPIVHRVNALEASLGDLLGDLYGNQASIPVEVIEAMEALMQSIKIDR